MLDDLLQDEHEIMDATLTTKEVQHLEDDYSVCDDDDDMVRIAQEVEQWHTVSSSFVSHLHIGVSYFLLPEALHYSWLVDSL